MEVEYPSNSFDVIYSRDAILHIKEKEVLFSKFYVFIIYLEMVKTKWSIIDY